MDASRPFQLRPALVAVGLAWVCAGCHGATGEGSAGGSAAEGATFEGNLAPSELFVRVETGAPVSDGGLTRGVAWGDVDPDDDPDLVVAHTADGPEFLYRNEGEGTFRVMRTSPIVQVAGDTEGVHWLDYDDDGDLDRLTVDNHEQANVLFRNDGNGAFVSADAGDLTSDVESSSHACWADFDGDGDLDLYVANWGGGDEDNDLYRNRTTERTDRAWLILELRADRHRTAVGARVRVWARVHGPGTQTLRQVRWLLPATGYASQNEPVVHFGLGLPERVDSLEIRWPSGTVDALTDLPVRRVVPLAEGVYVSSKI